MNNWEEIFCCSEHIKSGLLDAIAIKGWVHANKISQSMWQQFPCSLFSWLHVTGNKQKKNQQVKKIVELLKCWYMSSWYVMNIPLQEGRVWAVSRGGSGGQWGRGGSEGGGGSGEPDLLYPALKRWHYRFRQWSALYGCHITDWCMTQRSLVTRSCHDGHSHLLMVSVGTHGWS